MADAATKILEVLVKGDVGARSLTNSFNAHGAKVVSFGEFAKRENQRVEEKLRQENAGALRKFWTKLSMVFMMPASHESSLYGALEAVYVEVPEKDTDALVHDLENIESVWVVNCDGDNLFDIRP